MVSYEDAVKTLNTLQSNAQVIAKIVSTGDSRRHHNIPNMTRFLNRCDIKVSDLDKLSIIHISGTKGKGSTSAYCESILQQHGYKTGMFTSPHLITVNERFHINGKPVSKELFTKYFWDVYNKLDSKRLSVESEEDREMPTYFMFLTVMAFNMFLKENLDAVILEVGVGGEYDSTNVIQKPSVCGVSSLGLDHVAVLGDTIDKIAWQKAGIFKPGVPAVTVTQPESAMTVLLNRAKEKKAPLYLAPPLELYSKQGETIELGIAGCMQKHNATLALQLCRIWLSKHGKDLYKSYKKTEEDYCIESCDYIPEIDSFHLTQEMSRGLSHCYWPGRNQIISHPGVTYFLDGAHTVESIQQCMEWFKEASQKEMTKYKGPVCKILIFNATKGRNSHDMLSILMPLDFDAAVFCPNLSFAGNISNTPDQDNRTVTKEKMLQFCQINQSVWDSIQLEMQQHSQRQSSQGSVHNLQKHSVNSLDKDLNFNNSVIPSERRATVSHAFPCILQALLWATQGRDPALKMDDIEDALPSVPKHMEAATHLHVLMTGSLHLVGGALGQLNPRLW